MNKKLLKWVQISVSVICIFLFLRQINFEQFISILISTRWQLLLLSTIFFIISQYLSSLRLLGVFHYYKFNIHPHANHRLYLVGMFYNFFVPGGVGGDAYKIIHLNRIYSWSWKELAKSLLIDRAIGLGALLCLLLLLIPTNIFSLHFSWKVIIFFLSITFGYFLTQFVFKAGPIYLKTLMWSFGVQVFQMLSVVCLVMSLGISPEMTWSLLFVFLLTVIASLISFAGIGVREYLFLWSSNWLDISAELAAAVGVCFSLISAVVSFFGLYYVIFENKLKLNDYNTS